METFPGFPGESLMRTVVLSIIIVHFKTPELTLQCLRSLREFSPQVAHEIFLIDNGSKDGVGGMVAKEFPGIRILEIGRNEGFGRANNRGIQASRGRYILLLNSDAKLIMPSPDTMIHYLETQPGVVAVGPREIDKRGRFRPSTGAFPGLFSELTRKIHHAHLLKGDEALRNRLDLQNSAAKTVDWASGFCIMVQREALLKTGLFDENFFLYFEDIDLCARLRRLGGEVHYLPETTVVHESGASTVHRRLEVSMEYRRSQIYFARKYYGLAGEFLTRVYLFLKYLDGGILLCLEWCGQKVFRIDTSKSVECLRLFSRVMKLLFSGVPGVPVEPTLEKPSGGIS